MQRRPLKPGRAPWRRYDPTPLLAVPALRVDRDGALGVGEDGEVIIDVHHRAHPESRDPRGRAGLTVMSTADYEVLRSRYGAHVVDGIAGESILVERAVPLAGRDFAAGLLIEDELELIDVRVASPCVEFTRFCLGREPSDRQDDEVRRGLDDLDGGRRGFRAVAAGPGTIRLGARVWSRSARQPVPAAG